MFRVGISCERYNLPHPRQHPPGHGYAIGEHLQPTKVSNTVFRKTLCDHRDCKSLETNNCFLILHVKNVALKFVSAYNKKFPGTLAGS